MIETFLKSSATFSDDLKYRYLLTRTWDNSPDKGRVLFIMLNPSTADAEKFDPTVKRCYDYAHAWGFGELAVCNLFAYRATNPKELKKVKDPEGKDENNNVIACAANTSQMIIAAWGTHGGYLQRDKKVELLLTVMEEHDLYCLGMTQDYYPVHPLYQKSDLKPIVYKKRREEGLKNDETET